jgi:hypothetical protein
MTAKLTTELTWYWQDWRGRDHEADIEVSYMYDGKTMTEPRLNFDPGFDDAEMYRMLDYIESEYAPDAYADWLADQDVCHDSRIPPMGDAA